jgi:hypothetical protein
MMVTNRSVLVLVVLLASLATFVVPSAEAQSCRYSPHENPNPPCGGPVSGPVPNCSSSDPTWSPNLIQTIWQDLDGPPAMPGDLYSLTAKVFDPEVGQWVAVDIDLCLLEGLSSKVQLVAVVRNLCQGQLGQKVFNYSSQDRLWVRYLYPGGNPCEDPLTVQAIFKIKGNVPVGTQIHHTVVVRSLEHLEGGRLDSELDFTVGAVLPQNGD